MVALLSVRPSVLMTMSAQDQAIAENRASNWPVPTAAKPGRRMISAPRKPNAIAAQRRARTTSPSTSAASTVAKIGDEKPSAVTSDKGATLTA